MIYMKRYSSEFEQAFVSGVIGHWTEIEKQAVLDACSVFFPSDLVTTIDDLILLSHEDQMKVKIFIEDYRRSQMDSACFETSGDGKRVFSPLFDKFQRLYENRVVKKLSDSRKINIEIVKESGMHVCPYCNRNYINSRHTSMACQLDHFFAKVDYPFFAICLYNLIPSCNVCNHIKRAQPINISPFSSLLKDTMGVEFKYIFVSQAAVKLFITSLDGRVKENVDTLKLNEAYEIHSTDVLDMINTEKKYPHSRREEIRILFPRISDDEIDSIIFGEPLNQSNFSRIPLSKMKYDIFKDLKAKRRHS